MAQTSFDSPVAVPGAFILAPLVITWPEFNQQRREFHCQTESDLKLMCTAHCWAVLWGLGIHPVYSQDCQRLAGEVWSVTWLWTHFRTAHASVSPAVKWE